MGGRHDGFVLSSTYNGRPRPPEVLVDGSRWAIARRRERIENLFAGVAVDFGVVCPNSNIIGRIISPTLGALGGVTVAVTINGVDNGSVVSDAGGNFAGLFFWAGIAPASVDLTVTGGVPEGCTTPSGLSLTVAKGTTVFGHIWVAC